MKRHGVGASINESAVDAAVKLATELLHARQFVKLIIITVSFHVKGAMVQCISVMGIYAVHNFADPDDAMLSHTDSNYATICSQHR